jgi:hypothetical protein
MVRPRPTPARSTEHLAARIGLPLGIQVSPLVRRGLQRDVEVELSPRSSLRSNSNQGDALCQKGGVSSSVEAQGHPPAVYAGHNASQFT